MGIGRKVTTEGLKVQREKKKKSKIQSGKKNTAQLSNTDSIDNIASD